MIAIDLTRLLAESASEVLETMYFTGVIGLLDAGPAGEWVCTALDFRGSRSGSLGVRAPLATARTLAESFLGAEPETIATPQCFEVLGEMTNMICGAILSRLAPEEQFSLSPPQPEPEDWCGKWKRHTIATVFELEEGALALWLDWELP
ncbi:MAG TPA: chemotaxis protein CheX [Bryobacteraceae bacterium]|nr:chemotaxis protein CheX [Bryobacteraceae bacterium]